MYPSFNLGDQDYFKTVASLVDVISYRDVVTVEFFITLNFKDGRWDNREVFLRWKELEMENVLAHKNKFDPENVHESDRIHCKNFSSVVGHYKEMFAPKEYLAVKGSFAYDQTSRNIHFAYFQSFYEVIDIKSNKGVMKCTVNVRLEAKTVEENVSIVYSVKFLLDEEKKE